MLTLENIAFEGEGLAANQHWGKGMVYLILIVFNDHPTFACKDGESRMDYSESFTNEIYAADLRIWS